MFFRVFRALFRQSLVVVSCMLFFMLFPPTTFAQQLRHVAPLSGETIDSPNWAGYEVSGNPSGYTIVTGFWVVNAVTCAAGETSDASFWVGLGGGEHATGTTIEQTGTSSDCVNGKPDYYAWYEMYPDPPQIVNLPHGLHVNDRIQASVTVLDGSQGTFALELTNLSTGDLPFLTIQQKQGADISTAEWIVERDEDDTAPTQSSPLSNFGRITFLACLANLRSIKNGPLVSKIRMQGSPYRALTSDLGPSNTDFTVDWHQH